MTAHPESPGAPPPPRFWNISPAQQLTLKYISRPFLFVLLLLFLLLLFFLLLSLFLSPPLSSPSSTCPVLSSPTFPPPPLFLLLLLLLHLHLLLPPPLPHLPYGSRAHMYFSLSPSFSLFLLTTCHMIPSGAAAASCCLSGGSLIFRCFFFSCIIFHFACVQIWMRLIPIFFPWFCFSVLHGASKRKQKLSSV